MAKAPFQYLPKNLNASFDVLEFKGSNTGCSWHFHAEFQISLIVRGFGKRIIGDAMHTIEEGELTLLGSNLPHVWQYDQDANTEIHVIVVHFREDFAGLEFMQKPEMRAIRFLLARAAQGLQFRGSARQEVSKVLKRLPNQKGFKRMLGLIEILDVLANTKDVKAICSSGVKPAEGRLDIERLRRVCAFVDENLPESITRDEVASVAHLSPSAFSRFFKQHTGTTFQAFLNERRISAACQLLSNSELSMTEIAMQVGFSNTTSFNRTFRRLKDQSPSEYKQALIGVIEQVAF